MQVCTNICSTQVKPEPFAVFKRTFIEIVLDRKIRIKEIILRLPLVNRNLHALSMKTRGMANNWGDCIQ
jgi:hypothetical protein